MTKTTESVLFLFSPPMQACYSLSSALTILFAKIVSSLSPAQIASRAKVFCKNLSRARVQNVLKSS